MTVTANPPRRTRATERQAHEHNLTEAVTLLAHATTLTIGAELVDTLDSALLILTRSRHGSRDVLRTDRLTTRETHRRVIDQRIAEAHEHVYVCRHRIQAEPMTDDSSDALLHLDRIGYSLNRIGYR